MQIVMSYSFRYIARHQDINKVQIYPNFLQNCKKGNPHQMDLPLLKNDITGSELTVKILDT